MFLLKKAVDLAVGKINAVLPNLAATEVVDILPAQEEFIYQLPRNSEQLPSEVARSYQALVASKPTLPIRHLYVYKDVNVSYQGAIFKNLSLAIKSLCYPALKKEYSDSFLLKQWLIKPVQVPADVVVAVVHDNNSTGNYYHWLIEACPRILLLSRKEPACLLLVPAPISEYVAKTAALLGYTKLLPIKPNEVLKAATVLLAEPVAEHKAFDLRHHDPELLRELRTRIITGLNIPTVTPFRRIYVSRARQKTRRLVNEDTFVAAIQPFGFEVVYFENMSFEEQVQLLSETQVLLGAHGANLANALFMQPGAKVIEIVNEEMVNSVYFRLASYLKLPYYIIAGKPKTEKTYDNNSDLVVDIHSLQALLPDTLVSEVVH